QVPPRTPTEVTIPPSAETAPIVRFPRFHVAGNTVENSSVKMVPKGALLMVVRGMILAHSFPTALTTVKVTVNQDMKALVPFRKDIGPFLLLATKGLKREFLDLVARSTHGTCKLPSENLLSLPIPVPPIAEQHRIVARVDELMALLHRLEERLRGAQMTQAAFAAAAVHNLDA
ncbi:MAG: restriction endonuclease subunit S, partial [Phycisphaerales bacterium]